MRRSERMLKTGNIACILFHLLCSIFLCFSVGGWWKFDFLLFYCKPATIRIAHAVKIGLFARATKIKFQIPDEFIELEIDGWFASSRNSPRLRFNATLNPSLIYSNISKLLFLLRRTYSYFLCLIVLVFNLNALISHLRFRVDTFFCLFLSSFYYHKQFSIFFFLLQLINENFAVALKKIPLCSSN